MINLLELKKVVDKVNPNIEIISHPNGCVLKLGDSEMVLDYTEVVHTGVTTELKLRATALTSYEPKKIQG